MQTSITLLVSVFGLLKLTSEDENAIRNALSGYKILKTPSQIKTYLGLETLKELTLGQALREKVNVGLAVKTLQRQFAITKKGKCITIQCLSSVATEV